jgi:Kef-type K+ transport system membrane component KefB
MILNDASSPLHTEEVVLTVLVQLVAIILASRVFGTLFRRLGQPQVCGEIAAGLILGPSLLGSMFPAASAAVFDPGVAPIFNVMSQLGLVLLLFLIGMEFDFSHLRASSTTPVWVSLAGMAAPFGLGLLIAPAVMRTMAPESEPLGFTLFLGLALSVTALPILGRILIDFGLNRTRLGALAITAAALDDALAWIFLALVTAIVRSSVELGGMGWMVAQTLGFAAVMVLVARPLLHRWANRVLPDDETPLSLTALAVILVVVFLAAAATNRIGIFSIFGAFITGAILFDHERLGRAVHHRLSDFVTVFFLPIFFTYTGLRTDVSALQGGAALLMMGAIVASGIAGKLGACTLAARAAGLKWREAAAMGSMMNARALMGLIVVNVGYNLGILTPPVFSSLVIMCVVTTFMTAPLIRWFTGAQLADEPARVPVAAAPALTVAEVAS